MGNLLFWLTFYLFKKANYLQQQDQQNDKIMFKFFLLNVSSTKGNKKIHKINFLYFLL